MTTEGELIPIKRDINVLLKMDSYQDMTDEEIDAIIEYRVNVAVKKTLNEAVEARIIECEQTLLAVVEERAKTAQSVLKSMLEIEIPWVRVGGDS